MRRCHPDVDLQERPAPVASRAEIRANDRLTILVAMGLATLALYFVMYLRLFPLTQFDAAQPRTAEPFVDYLGSHPPTTWSGHGLGMALVFGLYVAAWRVCRAAADARLCWTAFAFTAVFCALFVFVRPEMTVDIIDYAFRSRMIVEYGISPLTNAPDDLPGQDAWHNLLFWREIPTPYGPLWLALGLGTYRLAGDSLFGNLIALKLLGAAAVLACVGLITLAMRKIAPERTAMAIVLFGWNPLVLIELVCNGHNDGMMVVFVLAALVAVVYERWLLVLPALAAAVLIKATAAIVVPFVLIAGLRMVLTRPGRRVVVEIVCGAVIAVLAFAGMYGLFWAGPDTLRHVSRAQLGTVINSPVAALLVLSKYVSLPLETRVVGIMLGSVAAFMAAYLVCLMRAWRGHATFLTYIFDGLAAFLFVGATWFWPWYVSWLLAPAALLRDDRRQLLAIVFSATILSYYLIKPLGLTGVGYSWFLLAQFLAPFAVLAAVEAQRRLTAQSVGLALPWSGGRPSGNGLWAP